MQITRHITGNSSDPTFQKFASWILDQIVNPLLALAGAVVVAYFIFGILKYFTDYQSGGNNKIFKSHLFYGFMGIIIVIGVYTILATIKSLTGSNVELK